MSGFSRAVVDQIVDRDQGCCVRCGSPVCDQPRGFSWSIHHRRPRGMGGSKNPVVSEPSNGIVLCGSGTTGCHGEIESNREDGRRLGFLVASHDDPELVPVLNWTHGTAFLSTTGGWWPIGRDYQGTDYLEWITAQRGVPADSAEYLRIQERILTGLLGIDGPNGITRDLDAVETEVVEDAWDREWGLS